MLLLILDFIIYTAVIVILHVILKNYLHNNIYSIEALRFTNGSQTNEMNNPYYNIVNDNNDNNTDNEIDEASWDEVSIQHKIINNDTKMYTDKESDSYTEQNEANEELFMLNDRKMFNSVNNSSKHLTQKDMWTEQSQQSELLRNDTSKYSSYWKDIKDEKISTQSYDSIVNLRSKEMETFFDDTRVDHIDIQEVNKQKLLDINNRISPEIPKSNVNTSDTENINKNNSINSNNTLEFKTLNNKSMFDKHNILEKQYNTLKTPVDTDSFLKTEQVEKVTFENEKQKDDDREYKLKKNTKELSDIRLNDLNLSDTRNTFTIINDSPLMNQGKTIEPFEAYDGAMLASI